MVKRPGLDDFLAHIFNKYKIMIWTSSKPATVKEVKKRLFPPPSEPEFVAIWTRDMLGLTPQQYNEKVQVYKRLDQIWKDQSIQSHYPKPDHEKDHENYAWNQRNTILIDDSRVKAAGHPHNIIEIPEFTNDTAVDEKRNMSIVLRQLRVLSHQQDVSRKIRTWADKQRAADPKLPYVEFWEAELESDEHALGLTEVIPIPGMKPEEKKKKKTKKQKKQEKEKEDKEEERKKNKKNQQESQLDTSSDVEKQITEAQTSLETNMHIGKDRKAHFDGLSDVTDDGNESDDISDNDDDEEDNGVDLFVPPNIIENDPATSETPRRRR